MLQKTHRFEAPPLLRTGDRIRIVAPCGPFDRARFESSIDWLRAAGLEPVYDARVFERSGYLAGPDDRRLSELLAAIDDDRSSAVWVARGGYGALRLLSSVDVASVRRHPKWLVGFSDVTALHALWARAGLRSAHAANVSSLASWSTEALDDLRRLLFEGEPISMPGVVVAGEGAVSGPLLGGNAALLASMVGTGFLPNFEGAVVLIEDVGEAPYRLDRILTQLVCAGAFERVVAFAVGQLTRCDDSEETADPRRAIDVVCERLTGLGVPVICGLPIGHEADARAVILGGAVTVDCRSGELRFER